MESPIKKIKSWIKHFFEHHPWDNDEKNKEDIKHLKHQLGQIIFGVSTPAGKAFDIVLIFFIILSIILVMLESVPEMESKYGHIFNIFEWIITVFFVIEYAVRVWIVNSSKRYIFSFYGIVDFLSALPSFLELLILNSHGFVVVRGLRLLRVFRIFKLTRHRKEGSVLLEALKASRPKIMVFLFTVIMIVVIIGTLMYFIEGAESGFVSIPRSIYWAIVTLTTVGYGDITPITALGQFLASVVMITGYGIIAIPTGIVTSELNNQNNGNTTTDDPMIIHHINEDKVCLKCGTKGHEASANFCFECGADLQ